MSATRPFVVRRKWATATDLVGLELVPRDGGALDAFEPGAHVEFKLKKAGAPPMLRQYSLCNAPGERDAYVFGIKLEEKSRGGSRLIHDALGEGDVVDLGAPRNHFPIASAARSHLLLAAGIGVTPLLAMAQKLHAESADYQLHYFVRDTGHVAFPERLQAAKNGGRLHVHAGLGVEQTRQRIEQAMACQAPGAHAYACGPKPFMDAVADIGARQLGAERLHFEHFQGAVAAPLEADTEFEVVLPQRGVSCVVRADQTIVQALEAVGCAIAVSCEQGVCGTCLTGVLEGRPDHRDFFLSDDERERGQHIILCSSRSHSPRLVLDL